MTANEAWIQNSLERLEELEQQREQLVASGQTYRLAEVDEEIAALYETLEAVADEEEEEAPAQAPPTEAAAPAVTPVETLAAAAPAEAPPAQVATDAAANEIVGSPFEAPVASAAAADTGSPFDAPTAEPMAGPVVASPGFDEGALAPVFGADDIDVRPPGSKAPLVLGLLVVVGGIGGGAWYLSQQKAPEPKPPPTGEAQVIDASAIPEDTQEPDAARGGNADRTEGIKIRESSHKRRGGGSRSSRPRSASRGNDNDKPGKKIELGGDTKDPLGGLK